MKKTLILFALYVVASLGVSAQSMNARSNRTLPSDRQAIAQIQQLDQEVRTKIARGLDREMISTTEAMRMLNEYQRIQQRERQYLANGRLNNRETRDLMYDLETLSRRITVDSYDDRSGRVGRR
ncbi:hypothetical protein [Telluribacter humicola]|uniref:hypothetical protein n=1 Tax=Telluribacter humicola TaxID=1720261 RepID=UPI001A97CA61|nr:hypothetical protein [Telluribacter humicola]